MGRYSWRVVIPSVITTDTAVNLLWHVVRDTQMVRTEWRRGGICCIPSGLIQLVAIGVSRQAMW